MSFRLGSQHRKPWKSTLIWWKLVGLAEEGMQFWCTEWTERPPSLKVTAYKRKSRLQAFYLTSFRENAVWI